jgi:thiol-disulfide isomerase/thioredoxin
MKRFLAGLIFVSFVAAIGDAFVLARADKGRPDKEIVADLAKVVETFEKEKKKIESAEKYDELHKKQTAAAVKLLKEFEEAHPKSPLLAEARSLTLKVMGAPTEEAQTEKTVELAKALKEVALKGSDFAAQADLVLLGGELNKTLRGVESAKELRETWAKNGDALHKQIDEFLTAYPKYEPALDLMSEMAKLTQVADAPKTRKIILQTVAKNFPDHALAKAVKLEDAIGKPFDFEFTPVGGKKTSLKDLKGKVVLIDFWATWCGPCKAEMPNLKKLYEKHNKDGFEIVGVSLDDTEKPLKEYVKENMIPWSQVVGETASKFADRWGIEAIPAMFVVDRNGILRSVEARGKLEKLIPELLAEKAGE